MPPPLPPPRRFDADVAPPRFLDYVFFAAFADAAALIAATLMPRLIDVDAASAFMRVMRGVQDFARRDAYNSHYHAQRALCALALRTCC